MINLTVDYCFLPRNYLLKLYIVVKMSLEAIVQHAIKHVIKKSK